MESLIALSRSHCRESGVDATNVMVWVVTSQRVITSKTLPFIPLFVAQAYEVALSRRRVPQRHYTGMKPVMARQPGDETHRSADANAADAARHHRRGVSLFHESEYLLNHRA